MKTRRLTLCTLAVAALVPFILSDSAHASLIGDNLQITVTHDGTAGGLVGPALVNHTFGGAPSVFNNGFFGSFTIASPAAAPGFDNAILVDFTTFNYHGFANTTGTIAIADIAENVAPGSVRIFAGPVGSGANIAIMAVGVNGSLTATWAANSVITPGGPATPDSMVVAWNSVPAPGALALLGLAGVVGGSRRRRA